MGLTQGIFEASVALLKALYHGAAGMAPTAAKVESADQRLQKLQSFSEYSTCNTLAELCSLERTRKYAWINFFSKAIDNICIREPWMFDLRSPPSERIY